MGHDAVRGIATYGAGCLPGTARQFAFLMKRYGAGSLGCYNPQSVAGGGPSLHAEGRAIDLALNANDPLERARGDALFFEIMAHPEQYGAQEMLWRGYLWSWRNRHLGRRGPGIQQGPHMNHVHLGNDVNAAKNWNESWVLGGPVVAPPPVSTGKRGKQMFFHILDPDNKRDFWVVGGTTQVVSPGAVFKAVANGAVNGGDMYRIEYERGMQGQDPATGKQLHGVD